MKKTPNNRVLDIIKRIKFNNILGVIIFIVSLPGSLIYKLFNKLTNRQVWLIAEEKDSARDNGYHFFKYMMEKNDDNIKVFYAIDYKSRYYDRIKEYGKNVIKYGSLRHYFIYMSASKNIISQKSANPNPPLFYFLHVILKLYNNRIFIQHGVVLNLCDSLKYNKTRFKLTTATTKEEYNYLINKYGYPKDKLALIGLARFDNLSGKELNKKQIVIMPSWRNFMGVKNKRFDFKKTSYYINWMKILNNTSLINHIEKENIIIYFYLHPNMVKFIGEFNSKSKNIIIVDDKKVDMQSLINNSSLMITDYSSVSIDFAYLKKPIIYYQFDLDTVRKSQYKEGYYKYDLGYVYKDYKGVIKRTIDYIDNSFKNEEKFLKRSNDFFTFYDKENCKRLYELLK